jgi:hypothetical protein
MSTFMDSFRFEPFVRVATTEGISASGREQEFELRHYHESLHRWATFTLSLGSPWKHL